VLSSSQLNGFETEMAGDAVATESFCKESLNTFEAGFLTVEAVSWKGIIALPVSTFTGTGFTTLLEESLIAGARLETSTFALSMRDCKKLSVCPKAWWRKNKRVIVNRNFFSANITAKILVHFVGLFFLIDFYTQFNLYKHFYLLFGLRGSGSMCKSITKMAPH
jgi:hypothetical protein